MAAPKERGIFRAMRDTAVGRGAGLLSVVLLSVACGGGAAATTASDGNSAGAASAGSDGSGAGAGGNGSAGAPGSAASGTGQAGGTATTGSSPLLGGCAVFPPNHLFNTPIDGFPVHANSAAFMATIGTHKIHLDLGTTVDPSSNEYYGIPYNVVHSQAIPWADVAYSTTDKADLDWDPTTEADCASGAMHALTSPCTAAAAPKPQFPIPALPLVEGGIIKDATQPYGDHHVLLLDSDTCFLWELYHVYPDAKGGWDIFGSAFFDLHSNTLRPAGWTSADAAGFPILPLLLRADEASSGTIAHALRFTIDSSHIRNDYTWPARHLTSNGSGSMSLPSMGQSFRIKSSYIIPANFNTQSRAILQALKTYGMYIADGGSALYIQGEPSANWQDDTFSQVQSVASTEFEAVDLSPISKRAGFDPNSATVP